MFFVVSSCVIFFFFFFFSSRRRHTRCSRDWSSDVCSSDLARLNNNALVWQRERAAGGSATAQRSLAFRYLTGDGVDKDHARGMDLLRKAAVGGDSAAQKELAKREPAKKE